MQFLQVLRSRVGAVSAQTPPLIFETEVSKGHLPSELRWAPHPPPQQTAAVRRRWRPFARRNLPCGQIVADVPPSSCRQHPWPAGQKCRVRLFLDSRRRHSKPPEPWLLLFAFLFFLFFSSLHLGSLYCTNPITAFSTSSARPLPTCDAPGMISGGSNYATLPHLTSSR